MGSKYTKNDIEDMREIPTEATRNLDESKFLADFNFNVQTLLQYIKQAPISISKQRELEKKIKLLLKDNPGNLGMFNKIKEEAELVAANGNIVLNSIYETINAIDNNERIEKEDQNELIKAIKELTIQFRKGKLSESEIINNLQNTIKEQIEEGSIKSEILSEIYDWNRESIQILADYKDSVGIENTSLTISNALQAEISDNVAQFQRILQDNNIDKSTKDISVSDLEKLISKESRSFLTTEGKKLIENTLQVVQNKDKLLGTTIQTLTEKFQALNNSNINNILEKQELTHSELFEVVKIESSKANLTQDQTEVFSEILTTLQTIETLHEKNQLSRADRIQDRLNEAKQITAMENIENYLEGLDDNKLSIKNMFSGRASNFEEMGEEAGDWITKALGIDDLFGGDGDRPSKGSKPKAKGIKGVLSRAGSSVRSFFSSAKNLAGKAAIPVAVGLSAYDTFKDYKASDNTAQREEAVTKGVTSSALSIAGGAIGTFIGGPLGTVIGAAAGNYIGNKVSGWVSGWFSDITDYIPDSVKNDPETELKYIDGTLVPNMQKDPKAYNIDSEKEAKKEMEKLEKHRNKLLKKISESKKRETIINNATAEQSSQISESKKRETIINNATAEQSSQEIPNIVQRIVSDKDGNNQISEQSSQTSSYEKSILNILHFERLLEQQSQVLQQPVIINNNNNTIAAVNTGNNIQDPLTMALR